MRINRKIITLGLVGVMVLGQSVNAFAAYTLNCSFGGPNPIGTMLNYSAAARFTSDAKMYLKADIKVAYTVNGISSPSYYISKTEHTSSIANSVQAFKTWTDENLSKTYTTYIAHGYVGSSTTKWDSAKLTKSGYVSEIS